MSAPDYTNQTDKTNLAIEARNLAVAYGKRVIQQNLNFWVRQGDIFIIMGGSGCGKSSVLRVLMGLNPPACGEVFYNTCNFWEQATAVRSEMMRSVGVLFQAGALWTSRTLAENIALPLENYTNLPLKSIQDLVSLKLALVGLAGYENYYPSEISGGMRKRAGLARALALDPKTLFLDDPSAGLDPISAAALDELILNLRTSLGMTILVVTHELASIFAIADDAIFLDSVEKTILAKGSPRQMLESGPPEVGRFLRRELPFQQNKPHLVEKAQTL